MEEEKKDVLLEQTNNAVNDNLQNLNTTQNINNGYVTDTSMDNIAASAPLLDGNNTGSDVQNPVASPFVTNGTDQMGINNTQAEISNDQINVANDNANAGFGAPTDLNGAFVNTQMNNNDVNVNNSVDMNQPLMQQAEINNSVENNMSIMDDSSQMNQPVNSFNTASEEDDMVSDAEIKKFFRDFILIAVLVIIIIILLPYVNKLIGF